MNSALLAAIFIAIFLLLVLTRRKGGHRGDSRQGRPGRHAPRGFGRRGSARSRKSPAGNGFDGAGYWNARDVQFRQEDRPPVDARKARGLEAALADDVHGKFGEAATSALVARAASSDRRKHFILQNVFIPTHAGYTEIDTVLLHVTGIYVFETKNISGEIEGDLDMERWNQELGLRVHHTLYNPIRQNTGHMGALLRQLKVRLESASIYSFVVFSDRCTLRNVPASGKFGNNGNGWQVLHLCELRESLEHAFSSRPQVYDSRTLESWWQALQPCVNVPESVRQNHVKSVQKLHTT